MKSLFYLLTILGGILGTFVLVVSAFSSAGAPQQAAGAAIAVALVAIPYCMARAFEKFRQEPIAKTLERLLRTDQGSSGRT